VKDGKIDVGSWLLVESLDRLSREGVLDAFQQFTEILHHVKG
jgi:DNA invertase Pin-like site-specific DNA recombinase